jgi:hypothetical protein
MGLVGSKNDLESSNMFQHAMHYLQTSGGYDSPADEEGGSSESDSDSDFERDDSPLTMFSGGVDSKEDKKLSAEKLAKELKDYRRSKSAKAKETIMKALIETLRELGIDTGKGDDIDSIIKTIEHKIPNPRKGDSFVEDSQKQREVCKKIAKAINKGLKKVYGDRVGNLIDPDGPPEYVCSSVVDLVHSFASGIYLEYIQVYDSVRKTLQELTQAEGILAQAVDQFISKVNQEDLDVDVGADKFLEIYKRADQEIKLKIQILNGLLQLNMSPSIEELELALKSEKEGRAYVNQFMTPGPDFSDTIAHSIFNLSTLTSITNTLNKSLKNVGMDMREYMSLKSVKELDRILNKKLDHAIAESGSDKKKQDAINDILIAIQKLKKYFGYRNKIKKMKGDTDEIKEVNVGGADPTPSIKPTYKSPAEIRVSKLKKRLDALNKTQEIFYNAFTKELYTSYDNLLRVVDQLGPKIGRGIPVGPHIDEVIQAFYRFSSRDLRQANFDKALSGIGSAHDAVARDIKDAFVQNIKNVIRASENAGKHGGADYFKLLIGSLQDVLDVIERFNKIAKVKFGGNEREEIESEIKSTGGAKINVSYFNPKYRKTDALALDEAVGKMIYFYYIANVKESIKSTGKELVEYGKNYDDMLSQAIRFKREDLTRHRNTRLEMYKKVFDKLKGTDDKNKKWNKGLYDQATESLNNLYKSFDNLLRVVESVELYLKSYTKDLVHNPDLVYTIRKTLESSKVIAKWFNEESGNELFRAFQMTTLTDDEITELDKAAKDVDPSDPNKAPAAHPYNDFRLTNRTINGTVKLVPEVAGKAETKYEVQTNPNEPEKTQQNTKYSNISDHISASVDNFQALQNIINTFVMIGGNSANSPQVLTPRQIFKFLVDFIKETTQFLRPDGTAGNDPQVNSVGFFLGIKHFKSKYDFIDPTDKTKALTNLPEIEDLEEMYDYFSFVIKAMVSKIFITMGLYQLLESPTQLKEISPVRFILGGSENAKIIDGAVELYYRVPRLMEYYRLIIDSTPQRFIGDPDPAKIAANVRTFINEINKGKASFITFYNKWKNDNIGDANLWWPWKNLTSDKVYDALDSSRFTDSELKPFLTAPLQDVPSNDPNKAAKEAANEALRIPAREKFLERKLTQLFTLVSGRGETHRYTGGTTSTSSISIIIDPEMKFYKLFSLFWDNIPDTTTIKTGTYSDIECDKIIAAINEIYEQYKHEAEPVKKILQEINFEVNRRYGIISKEEKTQFNALKRWRTRKSDKLDKLPKSSNMIDILPGDEDDEFMGVPSDNMIMDPDLVKNTTDPIIRQKYELNLKWRDALYLFRMHFEDSFKDITGDIGDYVRNTYRHSLAQTQAEVKSATSEKERMRIVKKLITGDHKLATISQFKVFMFHETVVYGLTCVKGLVGTITQLKKDLDTAVTNIESNVADASNTAFRTILVNAYTLGTDSQKLINFTFGSAKNFVQIDFSQIKVLIETLLSDVRKYIDLFRPYLPEEIIQKYERGDERTDVTDPYKAATEGTLVYFEELYETLLKPLENPDEYDQDEAEKEFEKTIYYTIKEFNKTMHTILTASPAPQFGHILAKLIFYQTDSNAYDYKVVDANSSSYRDTFGELFSKALYCKSGGIRDWAKKKVNQGESVEFEAGEQLYEYLDLTKSRYPYLLQGNPATIENERSLLFLFNHYLAQFLKVFYDKPSNKIYLNLIQEFISGHLSMPVNNAVNKEAKNLFVDIYAKDIPDPAGGGRPNITLGSSNRLADPNPQAVLFLSLALIIRNIVYTNNNGMKYFIAQNISEVPAYMREIYRVNLPYFAKVFDELYNLCEFLKSFIEDTQDFVDYSRKRQHGTQIPTAGATESNTVTQLPSAGSFKTPPTNLTVDDKATTVSDLKSYLENITYAIQAMKETCERVYREVADDPIYLQYEEDQYAKYHNRFHRYPLTPVSFNLAALVGKNTAEGVLLPTNQISSAIGRYNNGVRVTLLDTKLVDTSKMPYNKELVEEFNKSMSTTDSIDLSKFNGFVQTTLSTLRYLVNRNVYRGTYILRTTNFDISGTSGTAPAKLVARPGQDNYDVNNVFNVMLASNVATEIDKFVSDVTGNVKLAFEKKDSTNTGRDRERTFNFIDLNMIPFNPSALMRDLPLTNLFNYNYTFEKQLAQLLDVNNHPVSTLIFLLIKKPYADSGIPGQYIPDMFTGTNDHNFGRPKFISDQLYNKVLLQSVYVYTKEVPRPYREASQPIYYPHIVSETGEYPFMMGSEVQPFDVNIFLTHKDRYTRNFSYPYKDKNGRLQLAAFSIRNDPNRALTESERAALEKSINTETYNRFNTLIVRNMIFITNLYRVLRLKLEKDLVERHNILSSTDSLVDPQVTEFIPGDKYDESLYSLGITKALKP